MDSDVAILTSTTVSLALGMDRDRVERSEVTSHTANLLLEDHVVDAGFKATLASSSRGDIHGRLPTSENHKRLGGMDCARVERRVCDECLHRLETARGVDLGRLVLGRRNEVGPVRAPLKVGNGLGVHARHAVDLLASLCVPLRNRPVLVASNDVLVEVAEPRHGRLGALKRDRVQLLIVARYRCRIRIPLQQTLGNGHHHHGAQESHALLRDAQQLGTVLTKLDALDRRREVPRLQTPPRAHLPQLYAVIGAAGRQDLAFRVRRDRP